ncbi:MAG TPA: MOSC domain-containing protein [Dehalococcoidia bacterium]|jgi:MOSC domain-containing protein YiiM|nr:MOSC domain-containing protein [Dehalococcoidia bacterium]
MTNQANAAVITDHRLIAIFVARPKTVAYEGKDVPTAIFKEPITGPVMVRRLNIDGDTQGDLVAHGGVDKAVYCYPSEHYPLWSGELGRELPYGTFGENLTVSGFSEDTLHLDDVLEVGGVVLQVSQPRFPCYKLGIKMGDQGIVQRFQKSGRSGFYCRVLQEGMIEPGAAIKVIEQHPEQPTIADVVAARNKSA